MAPSNNNTNTNNKLEDRELPDWYPPFTLNNNDVDHSNHLRIYNSLTKSKDLFNLNNKIIKWYNCGPTVYDSAHLGHARLYVTVDYLKRILTDYFNFNVLLVMNITDIDDKIIVRAKQTHFLDKLKSDANEQEIKETLKEATEYYKAKHELDKQENIDLALKTLDRINNENINLEDYKIIVDNNKDVIGHTIKHTQHDLFNDLARKFENEFFEDMALLNVRKSDVVTRVSEYISEIIDFVKGIQENGYAYEMEGSIYFDTMKFNNSKIDNIDSEANRHYYAKLKPTQIANISLINEGEGQLSTNHINNSLNQTIYKKKSIADFALWKKSKPGEPGWESPWGSGRPGWHIECSAMAGHVLGDKLDIHSGGIDLMFPHHDNELAQSEAYYKTKQWTDYFLHIGHLHIEGLKMSKSLKNFVTIKKALEMYTSNQLRICFLIHIWFGPMDFHHMIMEESKSIEKNIKNFVANSEAIIDSKTSCQNNINIRHNYKEDEKQLIQFVIDKQHNIHSAFLDSINTPVVIKEILAVIAETNKYMEKKKEINEYVIRYAKNYIMGVETHFISSPENNSREDSNMEYIKILAKFRDDVRTSLLKNNTSDVKQEILNLCDKVRDVDLKNMGIVLDDRGKEEIRRQEELNEQINKAKQDRINEMKTKAIMKNKQKEEQSKIDPKSMFKLNNIEYGQFDENGIPTHLKDGTELSKSRIKKLTKEWEKQTKLYNEYLKNNN